MTIEAVTSMLIGQTKITIIVSGCTGCGPDDPPPFPPDPPFPYPYAFPLPVGAGV